MPDISFGIRAVDGEGEPVSGATVYVAYHSLGDISLTHQEEYTDADGWANFERPTEAQAGISATVYINGTEVDEVQIGDGDAFSFELP